MKTLFLIGLLISIPVFAGKPVTPSVSEVMLSSCLEFVPLNRDLVARSGASVVYTQLYTKKSKFLLLVLNNEGKVALKEEFTREEPLEKNFSLNTQFGNEANLIEEIERYLKIYEPRKCK